MSLIQITRQRPPIATQNDLFDPTRTLRYEYEPDEEEQLVHTFELEEWMKEPASDLAVRLIENNPAIFPCRGGVRHPLQELYAFPPHSSRFVESLGIAVTPLLLQLILLQAPFASASSGGKDGTSAAFAASELLDFLGHTGPRKIIFSDVGRLDWPDSKDSVQRLADRLRQELIIVEMLYEMIEQFTRRWQRNLERYKILKCVKLIKPFSSPGKRGRFCTSAKLAPITQKLVAIFPNSTIINATGIRRDESTERLGSEVCAPQPNLARVKLATRGFDYRPIVHWLTEHVFAYLRALGFSLPASYEKWQMTRHSCRYCIMSSAQDLERSIACPENHAVCLELVALEITSTFSFQQGRWLADFADAQGLLDQATRMAVKESKERAAAREAVEATISEDLLFCDSWPRRAATPGEADQLAHVRRTVARLINLRIQYDTGKTVFDRFIELLAEKEERLANKKPGATKPKASKHKRKRTIVGAQPPPQLSLLTPRA